MVKLSNSYSLSQDDLENASRYGSNPEIRKRQTVGKKKPIGIVANANSTKRSNPVKKSRSQIIIGYTILGLLCLGGFIKVFSAFYDIFYAPIIKIPINNKNKIENVMFGGDPWLVVCNDHPDYKKIERSILNSKSIIDKFAKIAGIPCNDKLPSGKLFCERFNFHPNTPGFIVPNGQNQKLISINTLLNVTKLEKFLASSTKFEIQQLSQVTYFNENCLDKKGTCILISQRSTPEDSFLNQYLPNCVGRGRKNKIIYIDTKKFQIRFDNVTKEIVRKSMKDNFRDNSKVNETRVLCLVNTQKGTKSSRNFNDRYYIKYFKGNINEQKELKFFIEECQDAINNNEYKDFISILAPPEIKKRSPKHKNPKSSKNNNENDTNPEDENDVEEIHITL